MVTHIHRTHPRIAGRPIIAGLLVGTLALSILARPGLAVRRLTEQAVDMGYSDRMVSTLQELFPIGRSLPPHVVSTAGAAQELFATPAEDAKRRLEERVYDGIVAGLKARALEPASLFVAYVGRMRVKVTVAIRTREMPYVRIRDALRDMKEISDLALRSTFPAMSLAELSTFMVLNQRNGKIYEYPVLYQSIRLPPFEGQPPVPAPWMRPVPVPVVEPRPDRPAAGRPQAPAAPQASPLTAPSPAPSPAAFRPVGPRDSYTIEDFYGAPAAGAGSPGARGKRPLLRGGKAPSRAAGHRRPRPRTLPVHGRPGSRPPAADDTGVTDFEAEDLTPRKAPAPREGLGRSRF